MLDKITEVKTQVNTLISWVNEMTAIVDNPYSNGLNVSKVLNGSAKHCHNFKFKYLD